MLSQICQRYLLGLPLPTDDPAFVFTVSIHIILSFAALVFGLVAMLKDKNSRSHATFGTWYLGSIVSSFATVIILTAIRWPHNHHLFAIGLLATVCALTGRRVARRKLPAWAIRHTLCMGSSFILLLTGFYVDNGEHLPFWRQYPQWFFWIFPSLIGLPIMLYVLKKHSFIRGR